MAMNFHSWLHRREHGLSPLTGDKDFVMQRIYKKMEPFRRCHDLDNPPHRISDFGAVFNLEYSPDGNVLIAACERKSIQLFDGINMKKTNHIPEAHSSNVNCVKFLDDRIFATCSDDTTVALWDLRHLKAKMRSLHGHSNWVKNIDYSQKDHLLVTSGFDGSIFTWDINSHTEQGLIYQKVFHTSGLMRCRIVPDGSKLVLCTTGGYMMIIHNLNLPTLNKDLGGFRPGIYRLMQMGNQYIPQAAKFDHVFSKRQKNNRVELVSDFPEDNDAEVIMSLQIHPQGHSFLNRNISYNSTSEWLCVHDILEEAEDITEIFKAEPCAKRKRVSSDDCNQDVEHGDANNRNSNWAQSGSALRIVEDMPLLPPPPPPPPAERAASPRLAQARRERELLSPPASSNRSETFVPDIWAAEVTVQERAIRQNRVRNSNSVTGYNFVYAISSGVLPTTSRAALTTRAAAARIHQRTLIRRGDRILSHALNRRPDHFAAVFNDDSDSVGDDSSSTSSSSSTSPQSPAGAARVRAIQDLGTGSGSAYSSDDRPIFQNPKKLSYFIKESIIDQGFIKEPCYSADGRVICSPYNSGLRLLAYNEDCALYPNRSAAYGAERSEPQELKVVREFDSHTNTVLCCKFSPRAPLLVAGCKSGEVIWFHPIL